MYPALFFLGPLTVYTFGVFTLLALFFSSFVIWKRGREAHLVEEELLDAVIIVFLSGLLGSRVVFIASHFTRFGWYPLAWLSLVHNPGLTFYGGLVAGLVALVFVCRRNRWPFFDVADIAVTGLSLGQAIGWVGAFFAGFGFGKQVERFGFVFLGSEGRFFPTQFLWAVWYLLLFVFLWNVEERYRTFGWYRGRRSSAKPGFLFFSYLLASGALELLVSLFANPWVYWYGIPVGSVPGLVLLVFGTVGLYLRSEREFREDLGTVRGALLNLGRRRG